MIKRIFLIIMTAVFFAALMGCPGPTDPVVTGNIR